MRRPVRPARRRGQHRLGQALVETALIAPVLVLVLIGGAQVGSIAYDQVSLDTAAREGARAGVAAPNTAVTSMVTNSYWYPSSSTYTCQAADFTGSPANPICDGVLSSSGLLDKTQFSNGSATVTITVVPQSGLASHATRPSAHVAGTQACNPGKYAEVTGTVTFPSGQTQATLSDTAGDTSTISSTSLTYIFCVSTSSKGTLQTVTAVSPPNTACGGYTWSVNLPLAYPGQVFTYNISFHAEPTCPTTTTSSTTSTTGSSSTSSSTSTTTTSSTSLSTTSTRSCDATQVPDQYYFTVTVSYQAPVFVPFINQLFQSGPGVRTIHASVTYPIEPCTMTNPFTGS